jgi:hypothetical protein
VTERELSSAVHLKAELDALRRVAAEESSADVLRAIDRQARAVEAPMHRMRFREGVVRWRDEHADRLLHEARHAAFEQRAAKQPMGHVRD